MTKAQKLGEIYEQIKNMMHELAEEDMLDSATKMMEALCKVNDVLCNYTIRKRGGC